MRRFIPIIPLLPLSVLPMLTACEEVLTDTDVVIPYVEELVVQGFLSQGSGADTIWISRALPPLEPWSAARAGVTDADVVITVGGVEHPLRHTVSGQYVIEGVMREAGRAYDLRVTSDELTVTATAMIPGSAPSWDLYSETFIGGCADGDTSSVQLDALQISTRLFIERMLVYSISYEDVITRNDTVLDRFKSQPYFLYFPDDPNGEVEIFSTFWCIDTAAVPARGYVDTTFATLYTYEPGFTRYYESRFDGNDDDLLFGPSVEDPDWNVRGDGFGWFFGRRVDYDTLVLVR